MYIYVYIIQVLYVIWCVVLDEHPTSPAILMPNKKLYHGSHQRPNQSFCGTASLCFKVTPNLVILQKCRLWRLKGKGPPCWFLGCPNIWRSRPSALWMFTSQALDDIGWCLFDSILVLKLTVGEACYTAMSNGYVKFGRSPRQTLYFWWLGQITSLSSPLKSPYLWCSDRFEFTGRPTQMVVTIVHWKSCNWPHSTFTWRFQNR